MNAYAGFDKVLDVPGNDIGATATVYYADDWKRLTESGTDTRFVGALFLPDAGSPIGSLAKMMPQDFRLKSDASVYGYGAVVNDLPVPAGEMNGGTDPHSEG